VVKSKCVIISRFRVSLFFFFLSFFNVQDGVEGSVSVTKQRTGSIGDRPARPTLLEQVLNKKRLVSFVFSEDLNSNK